MQNAFRTTLLIAALTGLFMAIGLAVGGTSGMMVALGFAVVTNAFAYWNADKLVLRLQRAEKLDARNAPDLIEMVAALSARAGIPVPGTYLIRTDQPNAFATGRNPQNAEISVSEGLIRHLDAEEVAAVIAHELAHIRSRDTLIMTLTATLAGATTMLAQFGLFFGGRNSSSPLGPLGGLLTIILAPLAAMMVQMAISRTREYEADRDGAEICGDPLALASALDKISRLSKNFENRWARRTPGLAHLFIINPLAGSRMDNLFSTHPNVRNRINALNEMARQAGQTRSRRQVAPRRDLRPSRPGSSSGWRVPPTGHPRAGNGAETQRGPWG